MKTFHCSHCQALVFFENVGCLVCGQGLAYLPDQSRMQAFDPAATEVVPGYRLCSNYIAEQVCNWAVPVADGNPLCESCRLTRVIPDLAQTGNREVWYRLERAKRRLLYTVQGLRLPVTPKVDRGDAGLAFEFLHDFVVGGDAGRVMTGHDNGLITVNAAEADDVRREQQRQLQHEPYRTLIGHFRHEIGHYYWDRLIAGRAGLEEFRKLFGDERAEYSSAVQKHYQNGPPADWQNAHVSAYASCHPWEDWAETWAHYLHMVDALETAGAAGLTIRPRRPDEPQLNRPMNPLKQEHPDFARMMEAWMPLAYVMNNLSRSLGQPDSYPFVLSPAVIGKLGFVHATVFALHQ
ncbi:MAG: putative zinc-binding metallopeptidase [Pseudomonadota bacterium]